MAKPPSSSMASPIRAYLLPLVLFLGAVFYQVFVIPKSFPPSHYDTLQIKRFSSIEEVSEAYEKLSSNWSSSAEDPVTVDFLKLQYAYEVLTNPAWKRNYDIFGIDEHQDLLKKAETQFAGRSFSALKLPLLGSASSDSGDHLNVISPADFRGLLEDTKPLLLQLFSSGSKSSSQFSDAWKKIGSLLNGTANVASVELGELQLVAYLAEKKPTGQPFFRNGLPSIVAFPPGCKNADCLLRYNGDLSVDAVTDWFSTTILGLPRIYYQSKETLGPKFIATVTPHKVKVIFFSKTGERASPIVRQAARDYWSHASFAFVLWRGEESAFWFNTFEVESAPAIVFLKDPGVKPVVYHGAMNNSMLAAIMEQNKEHVLPQLRSATSMKLGCDARGYSRAGIETSTWYCAILAGRRGKELNNMREAMRRVQDTLLQDDESSNDPSIEPAFTSFRSKRLTFTWLDGEAEKNYCFFYLNSETSYDTCGPSRDDTDTSRLFIVRYKRNDTEVNTQSQKRGKNVWDMFEDQDLDPAAQLVAKYNGSDDTSEILKWVSQIINDGDSRDLPHFRTKTPELAPEESEPIWTRGVKRLPSPSTMMVKLNVLINKIHDVTGDPRVGPFLLLGALMSFGTIWLQRRQPIVQKNQLKPGQTNEADSKDDRKRRRERAKKLYGGEKPSPSITDDEPKGAQQMPFSDSDSD